MNQEVKEYIVSRNNKVSENKVSFEEFLEYIKIYDNTNLYNDERENVGSVIHKEILKDVILHM